MDDGRSGRRRGSDDSLYGQRSRLALSGPRCSGGHAWVGCREHRARRADRRPRDSPPRRLRRSHHLPRDGRFGEDGEEIKQTLEDLLKVDCRILTLGQYLQPTKNHLPVERYVTPMEFEKWRDIALEMGFSEVASGPFVRSSYHAKELFRAVNT